MTGQEVLRLPMERSSNDAGADSVGEFLVALLRALWDEAEGFSGKRPLGGSDWQWQVYEAMGIDPEGDDNGEVNRADALIMRAIDALLV